MKSVPFAALLLGVAALGGCVAPVGPVEVTRFHDAAAAQQLGKGAIAVEAGPGMDPASLEFRSYAAAVGRELSRVGYQSSTTGQGGQVALLRVQRDSFQPGRDRNPVSVGVGGGTGSYGSGVGMGIGINLSGPPKDQVLTEMHVMIRNRTTNATIWEGRATFTVRGDAPVAQTQLGAAKMAEALFREFPGRSGETVEVK